MKKRIKDNWSYIFAPLVAVILLLIVYFCKGIYPFGSESIIEADLGQGYIPAFYNVHDILNGSGSIFWNFCLGAGSNFYGSFVLNALYSPFTLLFGLVPRASLINFVNILLLIKVAFLAFSSTFVFKKIYKNAPEVYIFIFGLLYALSGYIALSYHNIVWFDSLIVFPFFVLASKHLLDTGEAKWYVITLAIELILSYYISYMILMMIVFVGAVAICLYAKKDLKKKISMKVLLGTLLALAISAFAFLPSFSQSAASMRLSSVSTSSSLENPELYTKTTFYMCASLPILYYVLNIIKCAKTDKKRATFWILIILFPILGIFLEPVNKMWHTGSYNGFPYRYGFIPLFILSLGALSYINNEKNKSQKVNKKDKIFCISSVVILLIAIVLTGIFSKDIMSYEFFRGLYDKKIFSSIAIWSILYFSLFILATLIKNNKLKTILISIFTVCQVFTFSYWFIGMDNEYIQTVEHKDEIIKYENEISKSEVLDNENKIDRYKDTTASFEENYAYILNVPTVSSWLHIITEDQATLHKALGYSTRYTRTQDLGGTLFSDALYHIKYVFTEQSDELNETIYTKVSDIEDLSLYEKDVLPFGIINKNNTLEDYNDNPFDYQNNIYKNVFNKDNDIINYIENEPIIDGNTLTYNINLKESSELYLYTNQKYSISNILVNDEVVKVPILGNKDNLIYSHYSNNGIITLGTFKGKVTVTLNLLNSSADADKIYLGYTKIEEYKSLLNEQEYETKVNIDNNIMTINVDGEDGDYLLIPVTYNSGWTATVNGKQVEIEQYMINFMNIPLNEGENEIVLTFTPPRFKLSVLISIISLVIFIALIFLNKKFKIDNIKIFQYLFTILAILVYLVFLYKIYIGALL